MTILRTLYVAAVIVLWRAPKGATPWFLIGRGFPFFEITVQKHDDAIEVDFCGWPSPWEVWRELDAAALALDIQHRRAPSFAFDAIGRDA